MTVFSIEDLYIVVRFSVVAKIVYDKLNHSVILHVLVAGGHWVQ